MQLMTFISAYLFTSAAEQGAEVIFTYSSMEKEDRVKELISEIPNCK